MSVVEAETEATAEIRAMKKINEILAHTYHHHNGFNMDNNRGRGDHHLHYLNQLMPLIGLRFPINAVW